ncbi:MAG: bifunctional oligoribonuclease/PAP phosphatase NrnA [Clostridiales bacterium]|nr:bifunctional oligoribonuclease/PAP phosphatase NrnA [Clostridiales bacterium]
MSERITAAQAADALRAADRILILTHQYPDGDTLGSGFALCRALQQLGKTARVECADTIPDKYSFLFEGLPLPAFEPAFICSVDVADPRLLGKRLEAFADRIELCIDHHASNTAYARHLLLDAGCAATAELIYAVIRELGVPLNRATAEGLYTGIATDTGCFRYSNTTAATHRIAADLMEAGVRADPINRVMFDIKSRSRVELERLALESMRFYLDGRCAVMLVTTGMVQESGAGENDMEGLAPLPRQIEGVWVGVTMRQKEDGGFKVSVRSGHHADASAICARLGGGGHVRAAGCALPGPAAQAVDRILEAVRQTVPGIEG